MQIVDSKKPKKSKDHPHASLNSNVIALVLTLVIASIPSFHQVWAGWEVLLGLFIVFMVIKIAIPVAVMFHEAGHAVADNPSLLFDPARLLSIAVNSFHDENDESFNLIGFLWASAKGEEISNAFVRSEKTNPSDVARIALAGPLTTLVLAIVSLAFPSTFIFGLVNLILFAIPFGTFLSEEWKGKTFENGWAADWRAWQSGIMPLEGVYPMARKKKQDIIEELSSWCRNTLALLRKSEQTSQHLDNHTYTPYELNQIFGTIALNHYRWRVHHLAPGAYTLQRILSNIADHSENLRGFYGPKLIKSFKESIIREFANQNGWTGKFDYEALSVPINDDLRELFEVLGVSHQTESITTLEELLLVPSNSFGDKAATLREFVGEMFAKSDAPKRHKVRREDDTQILTTFSLKLRDMDAVIMNYPTINDLIGANREDLLAIGIYPDTVDKINDVLKENNLELRSSTNLTRETPVGDFLPYLPPAMLRWVYERFPQLNPENEDGDMPASIQILPLIGLFLVVPVLGLGIFSFYFFWPLRNRILNDVVAVARSLGKFIKRAEPVLPLTPFAQEIRDTVLQDIEARQGNPSFDLAYAFCPQGQSKEVQKAFGMGFDLAVKKLFGRIFDTLRTALDHAFETDKTLVTLVNVNSADDLPKIKESLSRRTLVGVVLSQDADESLIGLIESQLAAARALGISAALVKEKDLTFDGDSISYSTLFTKFVELFNQQADSNAQQLVYELSQDNINDKKVIVVGLSKTPYQVSEKLLSIMISLVPVQGGVLMINLQSILEAAKMA